MASDGPVPMRVSFLAKRAILKRRIAMIRKLSVFVDSVLKRRIEQALAKKPRPKLPAIKAALALPGLIVGELILLGPEEPGGLSDRSDPDFIRNLCLTPTLRHFVNRKASRVEATICCLPCPVEKNAFLVVNIDFLNKGKRSEATVSFRVGVDTKGQYHYL